MGFGTVAQGLRFRRPATNALDLTPSGHWAEPAVACEHPTDRGPVMILIEYRIAPEQVADFIKAIHPFKAVRKRDGALSWNVFEDAERPVWSSRASWSQAGWSICANTNGSPTTTA